MKDLTPETKLFFEQFLEVTPKNTREANCPKTTCLSGVGLPPSELAKIMPVLYQFHFPPFVQHMVLDLLACSLQWTRAPSTIHRETR